MEVVAASPSSAGSGTMPPYQRRDVEEWSHLDRLTGMLEHARVETDHWAANTHNSQHKYGKVVDSRDRCAPDGSQQQRQRRQLEVFQAHVPGGSLQVIRTQTVATSSSRWSSASSTHTTAASAQQTNASSLQGFENLQLALNPLDLSSQKTKASVGRSGSIGGRRPPSRPRSLIGRRAEPDAAVSARLQRVSRLCQQLHNETVTGAATITSKPSILERQNGDGSVSSDHFENNESPKNNVEHFWNKTNDSETNEWKKSNELTTSRNTADRWQFKNTGSTTNKNHSDLEADRRLNTALRGNSVDLEALDQILKSISSSTSNYSDKISLSDDFKSDEQPEKDDAEQLKETKSKKRHSFITVESLQEVRGRLRRLSSPIDGYNSIEYAKEEEPDDGIADAEDTLTKKEDTIMPASNTGVSRVRSYVYGMEAMLHNKKPIIGTGSLESRTSSKSNGVSTNRSEDWYNRRKSYGFEQVHNQQIDQTNSISLRGKNKIESSTDSGICRSTEIVVVPSVFKPQYSKFNSSKVELNDESTKKFNSQQITTSYSKIGNSTVINLNGDNNKTSSVLSNNSDNLHKQNNELFNVWNRRALFNSEDNSNQLNKKDSEQTTITIPIVAEDNNDTNNRRMYHRQMSDGSSMSIESSWPKNKQTDNQEIKRHSIAVDESKYVTNNRYAFNQDKRISLAAGEFLMKDEIQLNNDQEEDSNTNLNKKQKKVEFCKTEVHFAAESGRVNIVETDEKPPPTQNFRRRRRNSSVTSNHVPENYNKTGLPLIHFGDTTYEKKLFGVSDQETGNLNEDIYNKETPFPSMIQENSNNVTISSVSINQDYEPEREVQENESLPRGILKNKMIKPKPYILGDENNELLAKETSNEDQDSLIWGVRLKPVHKQEENSQPTSTPLWRSTVTVQNTSYNNNSINKRETVSEDNEHQTTSNSQPEFQKLLYSLRPARKSEPSIMTPEAPVEKKSTSIDLRRSSWSVADRIKQVEELKQENKGYSTRVNFGSGETTVVENGDVEKHTTWPRQEELHATDLSSFKSSFSSNIQKNQNVSSHHDKQRGSDAKITSFAVREPLARKHSDSSLTESPKVGKKVNNIKRNFEANRSTYSNGYLSSPSLVENSVQKPTVRDQSKTNKSETIEKKSQVNEERINTFSNKVSSITSKESPSSRRRTFNRKASPIISQYSYTKQNVPKKMEASSKFEESKATTLSQSGKSNKQWFDNRPDLLKNHDTKAYVNLSTVIKEENKNTSVTNISKIADIRKVSPTKTRPDSPSINRPESPIYENIDEVISNLNAMERESCMLQELTKAADQILQAVNGYTDEDSKVSTDSEDDGKKHRLKLRNTGELSTISETKSWKQVQNKSTKLISKNVKSRVRATSSTSSIESLTKETKPIPPVRLNRAAKLNEERTKKKITGSNSELSKITKARRLQRASSREALLQSHGSSSEDIAVNTDIRKPTRLVRKTKTGTEDVSRKTSVSQTNSITTTKKKEYDNRRYSDRVPVVGLQEIRHKTAISTIKSTAEKAASREKAMKAKAEELKKRTTGKRDTTSSKGSNTVSSHHGTISTHRSSTSGQCRGDVGSSGGTGSHARHQELSGAAVRTSSGVIKKT